MATCETCGTTILFGGVKRDGLRYCNATCASRSAVASAAGRIPEAEVEKQARAIHQGNCPKCQGPGPVDVHAAHNVYSFLVMTRWSSKPEMSCRGCARKRQLGAAALSMLTGWWGFPWGLIITPIQVGKNVGAILGMSGPDPSTPSPSLRKAVLLTMAAQQDAAIRAAAQSGQKSRPV
jgi:hypothetical protein